MHAQTDDTNVVEQTDSYDHDRVNEINDLVPLVFSIFCTHKQQPRAMAEQKDPTDDANVVEQTDGLQQ